MKKQPLNSLWKHLHALDYWQPLVLISNPFSNIEGLVENYKTYFASQNLTPSQMSFNLLSMLGLTLVTLLISIQQPSSLTEVAHENEPRLAVPSCHGRRHNHKQST